MKNTLILCILLSLALTAIAEFRREKGLSLHMLPKRVADLSDDKWGFTVTLPGKVKPGHVLQTSDELIKYFDELSPEIRSNGIWIVTTDPEAYTEAESMVLDGVKMMCGKKKIPLFTCRGSKLPNGWERWDDEEK